MGDNGEDGTPLGSQNSEPIDTPSNVQAPSPEPVVTVTAGRRRGRRKVIKKKTIKDEEGYLGTQSYLSPV